jgi:hypothetical protein
MEKAIKLDTSDRNYELIIPGGLPLSLRIFSRDVTLTDENGAPVDSGGSRIPFQASAGHEQAFTFTVSGSVRQ